jgi:UrcA family protein
MLYVSAGVRLDDAMITFERLEQTAAAQAIRAAAMGSRVVDGWAPLGETVDVPTKTQPGSTKARCARPADLRKCPSQAREAKVNGRTIACHVAAVFVATLLVTAAVTPSFGNPPERIVVERQRIDPELQRTVSYEDLNLAYEPDQNRLKGRIRKTANELCFDLNGTEDAGCYFFAVKSTRGQVADAIMRAKARLAGLPAGPDVAITMVISGR